MPEVAREKRTTGQVSNSRNIAVSYWIRLMRQWYCLLEKVRITLREISVRVISDYVAFESSFSVTHGMNF